MSHTPGPWKYEDNKIVSTTQYEPRYEEDEPTNVTVVNLLGAMGGDDVSADIRLIAAAPTMLNALIEAEKLINSMRQYMPKSVQNADRFNFENINANVIKAAIQKATQPWKTIPSQSSKQLQYC